MKEEKSAGSNWARNLIMFPVRVFKALLDVSVWLILIAVLVGLIIWRFGLPTVLGWVDQTKKTTAEFISPQEALFNDRGRVNVAVLGFGGDGHEGGDLADSIQIFSLAIDKPDAVLFAIPRDVWISDLNGKINQASRIGSENGQGDSVMKRTISDVTGMPIHYLVKIDFDGFMKLIDYVGGVEIQVERGFIDRKYPIKGKENDPVEANRYETLTFQPGRQIMNGETALKFVRSRHAEGPEGTDIARSKRQQLILSAVKNKLLNSQTLLDTEKIKDLWGIANQYIKTDVDFTKAGAWVRLGITHRDANIRTVGIPSFIDKSQSDTELVDALLYHPGISAKYNYEWVFVPKNNSFEGVHDYLECEIYKICK